MATGTTGSGAGLGAGVGSGFGAGLGNLANLGNISASANSLTLVIPNDKKYFGSHAGQKISIPLTSTGELTLTAFKDATDSLDPNALTNLYAVMGLDDKSLGANLSARAAMVLPALVADKGEVSKLDIPLLSQLAINADNTKVISYYKNAQTQADQPVLLGQSQSAIYSAMANAQNYLTQWNIDTPEVEKVITDAVKLGMTNLNEVMNNIRSTETYRKAFAGLAEYNAVPGHIKMTENEYRSYSQAVMGAAQQYGGFTPSQAQIGEILKGNVSAAEFNQRVQDIAAQVNNADQNVKDLLKREFNVDTNHLFAWWANPKEALPDLQRAVATADVQDYAQRVGLGGLSFKGAEQLAQMAKMAGTAGNQGLGYGIGQIENAELAASRDVGLTKTLPGQNTPTVNTNTLLASQLAGFGGINQIAAQTQVARAEEAKVAPFEKGGGYAESAKGVIGLGSART